MEKVKRVFAILGLAWVISILFGLVFPRTWLACHTFFQNFWFSLLRTGNPNQGVVKLAVAVSMVLLAFLVASGVVWGIKKARG